MSLTHNHKELLPKHHITGKIGENAVTAYLESKGFAIKDRNYLRKWGELDIVAEKEGRTHFIEVKSMSGLLSREKNDQNINSSTNLSRETSFYRAEDNMHPQKIERLKRILQTYLLDKDIIDDVWQFDLATVVVDQETKVCKVSMLWNLVL